MEGVWHECESSVDSVDSVNECEVRLRYVNRWPSCRLVLGRGANLIMRRILHMLRFLQRNNKRSWRQVRWTRKRKIEVRRNKRRQKVQGVSRLAPS